MKHIEDELRGALAEVPAPDGFAERVMARVRQREARRWSGAAGWRGWLAGPGPRWAIAAALCVALACGGVLYQRAETRMRGERAKEQLMLALHIAANELQFAQATVSGMNGSGEVPR